MVARTSCPRIDTSLITFIPLDKYSHQDHQGRCFLHHFSSFGLIRDLIVRRSGSQPIFLCLMRYYFSEGCPMPRGFDTNTWTYKCNEIKNSVSTRAPRISIGFCTKLYGKHVAALLSTARNCCSYSKLSHLPSESDHKTQHTAVQRGVV